MKKMSLKEFQRYCEKQRFNSYIYASDNQLGIQKGYLEAHLVFNDLHISLFPKMLLFIGVGNSIQLNCVRQIIVEEDCVIGNVCAVVCGCNDDKSNKNTYVFIARW